uniref:Rab3GAP regulatory subunit C-terminal domain-containing protein n=1 Tax=Plectus sambesii TaxID=2011161 RepID=A0A914UUJ6_9BILA
MALRARPSTLFDDKGRRAMFVQFHSHPLLPLANVDDQVRAARQKFVEQCVKAAVDAAASAQGGRLVPNCAAAVELAKEWQLDVDRLRVDEILALYRMGRDKDGERLLPLVQDRLPLGDALLPLLGERLKHLLAQSDSGALNHVEKYSLISTRTVEWLRSLPETVAQEELNCDNLRRLARQVESCLSSAGEGNAGKLAVVDDLNRLIEHI